MCSLIDAREARARKGGSVRKCERALTQKRTLWGHGVLEIGDLSLLEDGSERGGALDSDGIALETARDGWGQ